MTVVALTVLLLAALTVVTIFSLTRLQQPEIPQDVASTRALQAAHAGIERALEEIPRAAEFAWHGGEYVDGRFQPGNFWTCFGEDLNANGSLDAGEDSNGNGAMEGPLQPLEELGRPSLAVREGSGIATVLVNGRPRGVSGWLQGTNQARGDHYVLRISDSASRIWINGPADNTLRMLLALARRLGLDERVIGTLMHSRPPEGYRTEEDLIPHVGEAVYRAIAPYITAHAWADPRTLALPVRRVRPLHHGDSVYSLGDLRITELRLEARAPVNLNTAPAPVLAAVFEGIQAQHVAQIPVPPPARSGYGLEYAWMEQPLAGDDPVARFGVLLNTPVVGREQADILAAAAVRHRARSPFRTWTDFGRFLRDRVAEGTITDLQAEAIRANADPNALLNDFNPDRAAWVPIDKTDLLRGANTTEFCFSSMGYFRIESLGRVLDRDGRALAQRVVKLHVRAYEVWRDTVESEFFASVVAGASLTDQIDGYSGEGMTRDGLALAAYPEPLSRAGAERAWYDGRIGLATLIIPGTSPGTTLRASLTPGTRELLEADDAVPRDKSLDPRKRSAFARARQPHPVGSPLTGPLITGEAAGGADADRPRPGNHFPDGAYLERDASLRYRAADILPARPDGQTRNGSVSFWFKPAFDPALTSHPRTLWSLDRNTLPLPSASRSTEWPPFGAYLFPPGENGSISDGPYSYGFPLAGLAGFGIGYKSAFTIPNPEAPTLDWVAAGIATGRDDFRRFQSHRWVHVACAWDFDRPANQVFRFALNGRLVPAANAFCQFPEAFPLRGVVDLSRHGGEAPVLGQIPDPEKPEETIPWTDSSTWVSFGALASDPVRNFALDGTVDEIRIGTVEAFEAALVDAVEGRFARVDRADKPGARQGADFRSARLKLSTPVLPGSIAWTVREAESLPDSTIRLEFWDGQHRRAGPFDDPAGARLADFLTELPAAADWRYQATFVTGVRRDAPVLETPYLEDVTITWAATPVRLAWSLPPLPAPAR